jgi:hypothetical protein
MSRKDAMPYRLTLTGKHKITGKLEKAIETFRSYHRADFPPGTLPLELPFKNYLGVMADFLGQLCQQEWKYTDAADEVAVMLGIYRKSDAKDPHFEEMALYKLLDYIIEVSPPDDLSGNIAHARQAIIDNKEELFMGKAPPKDE